MDTTSTPSRSRRFRSTLLWDGRPGPIEERLGRRLLRLVDPGSKEGLALMDSGEVEWMGPDGSLLGPAAVDLALTRIEERLTALLGGQEEASERDLLEESLRRLRSRPRRSGNA